MDAGRKRKLAMAGAVLGMAVVLLLTAGAIRSIGLSGDDGSTTEFVRDAAVRTVLRAHADEATDWFDVRERLRVSVLHLVEEQYVVDVWLVRANGDGRISYASGGPGKQGDLIVQLAGAVGEAAKASDTWVTSGPERYVPVAVAAMSRNGDHADAFRYLAVPVAFTNGDGAIVAVSYHRTPAAADPGILYRALLGAGVVAFVAFAALTISAIRRRPEPYA